MRLLLFAIAIIWLGNKTRASDERALQDKFEKGVSAITEIVSGLGDDKHYKNFGNLGKLARNIAPFLGAAGPAVAFLGQFFDTPELTAIKSGFKQMDGRFDDMIGKFDELKSLILHSSLKNQYTDHTQTIQSLSHLYHDMLNAKNPLQVNGTKNAFTEAYQNGCSQTSALTLWQGMMKQGIMSDNIPIEAMKIYDNDRGKVMSIMQNVFALILKGSQIELTYKKIMGDDNQLAFIEAKWVERLTDLTSQMQKFDQAVKDKYNDQMKKDIGKRMSEWRDKSHENFANELYKFLADKYFWRYWFVISYKESIGGADLHWGGVCQPGGYHWFRQHGRNLRVASVGKEDRVTFDRQSAGNDLSSTKLEHCTWWGCQKFSAIKIYENIPKKWTTSCSHMHAVGVILSLGKDDVKWAGPEQRIYYISGKHNLKDRRVSLSHRIFMYLFG